MSKDCAHWLLRYAWLHWRVKKQGTQRFKQSYNFCSRILISTVINQRGGVEQLISKLEQLRKSPEFCLAEQLIVCNIVQKFLIL